MPVLHGHAHLSLNQIDLSFSYRILHGKPLCIVFMHELIVTEIKQHEVSLPPFFHPFGKCTI